MKSLLILSFVFLVSCSHNKEVVAPKPYGRDYQISAFLWVQTSGEWKALCYQAYNLAKLRLDRDLENKHNKKRALIFDIDETVLDNSVSGSDDIKKRKEWSPDGFSEFVKLRKGEAIAGAKEFIEYAQSRQVEVFFISNRTTQQIEDSYANLVKVGIPVKKSNLLFQTNDWSKEARRNEVERKYDVVMYFGDNLGDFHKDWDKLPSAERRALVDKHKDDFGNKFIVLPNPLYGDWETSLPKNVDRMELLKSIQ